MLEEHRNEEKREIREIRTIEVEAWIHIVIRIRIYWVIEDSEEKTSWEIEIGWIENTGR